MQLFIYLFFVITIQEVNNKNSEVQKRKHHIQTAGISVWINMYARPLMHNFNQTDKLKFKGELR